MVSDVISWLEEVLPDIKRTGDPEGEMLKFAAARNLAPALLEKLAQVYNTAKTMNFLEKAANRGDSFNLVDSDSLIRRYVTAHPKAVASAPVEERWFNPRVKSASADGIKAASRFAPRELHALKAACREEIHSVTEKYADTRPDFTARDHAQRSLDTYEQIVFDLREDAEEKAAALVARMRTLPDFDFAALESEALALDGQLKVACDMVSARLMRHLRHKRASGPTTAKLIRDEHRMVPVLRAIQDDLAGVKVATALRTDLQEKFAATAIARQTRTAVQPDPAMTSTPQGRARQITSTKGSGNGGQDDDSGGGGAPKGGEKPQDGGSGKGVIGGALDLVGKISVPRSPLQPGGMIRSLVEQALPTRNTGQERVDRDFDDLQTKVVVERLLHLDPILREADPALVASLADSIRAQSPHVARDFNAMRFALREAVQYNALPTHTVKDLAGVSDTRAKTEQTQGAIDRDKYSQGIKPKKAA